LNSSAVISATAFSNCNSKYIREHHIIYTFPFPVTSGLRRLDLYHSKDKQSERSTRAFVYNLFFISSLDFPNNRRRNGVHAHRFILCRRTIATSARSCESHAQIHTLPATTVNVPCNDRLAVPNAHRSGGRKIFERLQWLELLFNKHSIVDFIHETCDVYSTNRKRLMGDRLIRYLPFSKCTRSREQVTMTPSI
jgi:hypothetical protein